MELAYFRLAERVIVAVCVPILLYIGYRLFESGATGRMNLTAQAEGGLAKLTNLSPGALCFVLSVALAAVVMFQEVRIETPEGPIRVFSGFGGVPDGPRSDEGLPTDRGGPNEGQRLSDVIESTYSEIGLKIQDLVARSNVTIQDVDGIITSTLRRRGLRQRVTQFALDEIRAMESGEIDDNQALSQRRADILEGGQR